MDIGEAAAVGTICSALSAAASWYLTRANEQRKKVAEDTTSALKAQSAENLAAACLAKLELLATNLHTHEINDAAAFAKLETLVNAVSGTQVAIEARIAKSLEELGERLDAMTQRFDRFLDR